MNKAIGMLAVAALLLWMAPANAATFFFTNDHCTGTCGGATPYASITLTDTVQGVDILLTPLNGNQFNTAGGGQPILTGPGFVTTENVAEVKALVEQGTR